MDKKQLKFNKEIGMRIRDHREFLNYTREQLSEKSDISTQFLADIENGRKSMTARTLRNLSNALSLSADYILNGSLAQSDRTYETEQLMLLLEGFTPYQKECAVEILKAYAKALSHDSTK